MGAQPAMLLLALSYLERQFRKTRSSRNPALQPTNQPVENSSEQSRIACELNSTRARSASAWGFNTLPVQLVSKLSISSGSLLSGACPYIPMCAAPEEWSRDRA